MKLYIKISNKNTANEVRCYFKDKECKILHREDGPAVECIGGEKQWWLNGKIHREDGPAVIRRDGTKVWMKYNKYTREDGPAIEYNDGRKLYCVDNCVFVEEIYWQEINKRKRFGGFF